MCVVVPALIVDVLSVPYGALTLPLDISVYCRLDFPVLDRDNADNLRDNRTRAVLENATSGLLVRWRDRCMYLPHCHMLLGGAYLFLSCPVHFIVLDREPASPRMVP